MKKAVVAIDRWKLEIFKKHLEKAGYKFEEGPGVTPDTMILTVEYWWVSQLSPVVKAANDECARLKKH